MASFIGPDDLCLLSSCCGGNIPVTPQALLRQDRYDDSSTSAQAARRSSRPSLH